MQFATFYSAHQGCVHNLNIFEPLVIDILSVSDYNQLCALTTLLVHNILQNVHNRKEYYLIARLRITLCNATVKLILVETQNWHHFLSFSFYFWDN